MFVDALHTYRVIYTKVYHTDLLQHKDNDPKPKNHKQKNITDHKKT